MTQAQNTMSTMVNRIVNEQIAAGTIDYDRMIYFEKDVDGGITALKTNMSDETQQEFLDECADGVKSAAFVHLSSVNVESDSLVRSAYLVATDDDLTGYMDFHSGTEELAYPETGQCLINKNLSEQYGLRVGDTVTVYDSDRNSLTMNELDQACAHLRTLLEEQLERIRVML